MPSIKYLDVRIFGDEEVMEELAQGMQATVNMTPALDDVADDMMMVIFETFQAQGRRGGGSWAQLSDHWAKHKAKKGWDPRILFAQHPLYRSWTIRGDENQDLHVGKTHIRLDSKLDYAEVHQFGGGHVPRRPYINFRPRDVAKWVDICEDHIYKAMDRLR